MKINYASLHNMNETYVSFEAMRPSGNSCKHEEAFSLKQKTNKRKNNVVRGFKRIDWEVV